MQVKSVKVCSKHRTDLYQKRFRKENEDFDFN